MTLFNVNISHIHLDSIILFKSISSIITSTRQRYIPIKSECRHLAIDKIPARLKLPSICISFIVIRP
jgi:hypothetical protein